MQGKVVLITGASSGIGAGTAVHFASRGCLLSLTGRNQSRLEETQKACVQAGAKEDVLLISADLLVHENRKMIVDKTIDYFGKLDTLINNAGIWKNDLNNVSTSVEDYDAMFNTNLKSTFFLTQAATPHLIKSKGSVVNISGCSSQRPYLMSMVCSMGKAALDHFTRMLALQLAPQNVRVNSVNPGTVLTPGLELAFDPASLQGFVEKFHAMKRAGTIDEIAKAIEFLADNDQSAFVTGVCLLVDGGAVLKGPL